MQDTDLHSFPHTHTPLGKHLLAYKVEGVRPSVLPFRVGVLCPLGNLLNTSPQSCPLLVTCLGQVRNSSTLWFGGEGASSLRTPNCRRALGLLFLDWSSECSTTPLVLSRPDGRPCLSRELLVLVRAVPNAPNECDRVCLMTLGRCTLSHVDWATCLLGADIKFIVDLKVSLQKLAIFWSETAKCPNVSVNSTRAQSYTVYYEVMPANIQVISEKSIDSDIFETPIEVLVVHFRDKIGRRTSILV